jgi:transglutaminase-like putative cysteine protease
MHFRLGCSLEYEILTDTTMLLNVEAQHVAGQRVVSETLVIEPRAAFEETHEVVETGNRYRRVLLRPGQVRIRYEAEVETQPRHASPGGIAQVPVAELPFEVVHYLYPSRYCPSDLLGRFAWRQFGGIADGHEKVTAICNWIFENVDYLEGSSDVSTSAHDTFTLRAGVCRDFAHLGISFARALGIPARFVSAYAVDLIPQDFHAVFECWLGGRWYLFDATRLCPLDGIARIATGRDAADSAFSSYFGTLNAGPKSVWINRLDSQWESQWTSDAISLGGNDSLATS